LDQAIREEPELRALEEGEGPGKKLLRISRILEGLARHASTHACGVVIADRPLVEYLPLYAGSKGEVMAQFTMEKIEQLGGIGFFLGGIGPDGHIGFNIKGSDHFSTTRLAPINYETAAVAAADLGGIETARDKAVITIGLKTIIKNNSATAIIIAAGESKSKVVSDAIEKQPSILILQRYCKNYRQHDLSYQRHNKTAY